MGKWLLLDDGAIRVHILLELPFCTFRNKVIYAYRVEENRLALCNCRFVFLFILRL